MPESNFMIIHPVVVQIILIGPKGLANQPILPYHQSILLNIYSCVENFNSLSRLK